MKKFFILLAAGLFLFAACEPAPVLMLSHNSLEFSSEGGSQTISVTANNVWTVTPDNSVFTVSPVSGTGNGFITITAKPNTTEKDLKGQITVVCTSRDETLSRVVEISQKCPMGYISTKTTDITPAEVDRKLVAEGCVIKINVVASAKWTVTCDATDVTMNVTEGTAGTTDFIATVPACPVFEGRKIQFHFACVTAAGGNENILGFTQLGGIIVYGGETYHAVQMKDGKWWMSENLRYVPEGMTPSSDLNNVTAGVYYPLVMNADNTGLAFSTDAAVIKANGYLYQAEVALGKKVGDLTSVEAAEALNGTQGICPKGWHVPTSDDIINLVGKAVSPLATKTDAPYYDGNNGSIVMLNADGFNLNAFGAVSIQDNTKTAGTFMGWAKTYPEKISSGMFCGSTYAGVTYNTKDDPTSGVKNLQFFGFMPMTNKATEAEYTCNGSKVSYRIAAPLRCVKDN